MSYELSIPKSRKYILCRVKKPITADLSREILIEVKQFGEKHNLMNYLFDSRGFRNIEKAHRMYKYAYEDLKTLEANRTARAAILVNPDDNSYNFSEVVLRNAGYNVKLFRDEDMAIKWLKENK